MKKTFFLLASTTLTALSTVLTSANGSAQIEELTEYYSNWYQVEVFIFENKKTTPNKDPEDWPKNIVLTYPVNIQYLIDPNTVSEPPALEATEDASSNIETEDPIIEQESLAAEIVSEDNKDESLWYDVKTPFELLPNEKLSLNGEIQAMIRSKKYRPLFHAGWLQPFKNKDEAENILIIGGEKYGNNNELEGTIALYLSRYLHIETNLWKTTFEENFSDEYKAQLWPKLPEQPQPFDLTNASITTEFDFTDKSFNRKNASWQFEENSKFSFNNPSSTLKENPEPHSTNAVIRYDTTQIVTLKSKRRMRSNELHYIDHPQFGMLIKIDKFNIEKELEERPIDEPDQ